MIDSTLPIVNTVDDHSVLCPSARCVEGAILLGAVRPDGAIGILPQRYYVTAAFVDAVGMADEAPERRFRFAAPCQFGNCQNWQKSTCQVIELALTLPVERKYHAECAIRDDCRWFAQRGKSACEVCPLIATDI